MILSLLSVSTNFNVLNIKDFKENDLGFFECVQNHQDDHRKHTPGVPLKIHSLHVQGHIWTLDCFGSFDKANAAKKNAQKIATESVSGALCKIGLGQVFRLSKVVDLQNDQICDCDPATPNCIASNFHQNNFQPKKSRTPDPKGDQKNLHV